MLEMNVAISESVAIEVRRKLAWEKDTDLEDARDDRDGRLMLLSLWLLTEVEEEPCLRSEL